MQLHLLGMGFMQKHALDTASCRKAAAPQMSAGPTSSLSFPAVIVLLFSSFIVLLTFSTNSIGPRRVNG